MYASRRGFRRTTPLRPIRKLVDETLLELSPAFSKLYSREGRPSIPPERLLRAILLQALSFRPQFVGVSRARGDLLLYDPEQLKHWMTALRLKSAKSEPSK